MHTTLQVWTCDGCQSVVNIEHPYVNPPATWSGITFVLPGETDIDIDAKHFCGECTFRIISAIPAPPPDLGPFTAPVRKGGASGGVGRANPGVLNVTWDSAGFVTTEETTTVEETETVITWRPPSIAEGTVSQVLVDALEGLIDSYGLAGVQSTLQELADTEEQPWLVNDVDTDITITLEPPK